MHDTQPKMKITTAPNTLCIPTTRTFHYLRRSAKKAGKSSDNAPPNTPPKMSNIDRILGTSNPTNNANVAKIAEIREDCQPAIGLLTAL